jgi:hypothetical protein
MGQRARQIYYDHQNFTLLLVLFVAFRLMTLLLYRPGGFIGDFSDFNTSFLPFARFSDQGLYPFVHYWLEWPPLFAWLVVGVYRLSLLIPAWTAPGLWYNTLLGLSLLPFEVGNFILIYLIGLELYDRGKAFTCALIYACLFAPVYIWSGWSDCMPLFFLLLGLYLILRGKAVAAGVAAGVGFWVKVIPILLAPVGLRVLAGGRRKALFCVAVCVTLGLVALPFLYLNAPFIWAFLANTLGRSSWESVWALLEGYYSYGVVTPDRFTVPSDFSTHPSTLPWLLINAVFGLVLLWLYTRRRDYRDSKRVVALTGLTVNLLTLFSKGYSPQFIVQLIPFAVLLLPSLKGAAYVMLLDVANFLEASVYFIMLPNERWVFVAAIVARTLLIVALTAEYAIALFDVRRARIASMHRRATTAFLAFLVVGGCVLVYPLARAYDSSRYAQSEYRPVMEILRASPEPGESALILTDQSAYQQFYPFLRGYMGVYFAADDERLPQIAADHSDLWLFQGQGPAPDVQDWLDQHAERLESHNFANGKLYRYHVLESQ